MKFFTSINAEASTAHVTQKDMDLLEAGKSGVVSYSYEYGARVYLSQEEEQVSLVNAGFSSDFIKLFFLARDSGAQYLLLDCDGEDYDELHKNDW